MKFTIVYSAVCYFHLGVANFFNEPDARKNDALAYALIKWY